MSEAQSTNVAPWRWATGAALAITGAILSYGVEIRNWRLAQLAAMAGIALLTGGVALLASALSSDLGAAPKEEPRDRHLRRLGATGVLGLLGIFVYSVQYRNWAEGRVLLTVSVGFIAAGAAWFTGTLLGFLFGIPRTREPKGEAQGITPRTSATAPPSQLGAGGVGNAAALSSVQDVPTQKTPPNQSSRYEPGTGLEQIADWLTKIIVGVGLTQLNSIPGKLDQLARYIGEGMNADHPNSAIGLGICIYFSVSGFLFGFLWARLYMTELFNKADKPPLEGRVEEVEEITNTIVLDRRARDLVRRQLDPSEPAIAPEILQEAIVKASDGVKLEVLELARDARKSDDAGDDTKARAIPVLQALISADKDSLQHRYYSELAYIFRDFGRLAESIQGFTTAINIRNRRGKSGWKSYELERAKAQIRLDSASGPSAPDLKEAVTKDLRAAWSDPKLQDRIRKPEIIDWLNKNSMTIEAQISNP
jgi:hypothetical protein